MNFLVKVYKNGVEKSSVKVLDKYLSSYSFVVYCEDTNMNCKIDGIDILKNKVLGVHTDNLYYYLIPWSLEDIKLLHELQFTYCRELPDSGYFKVQYNMTGEHLRSHKEPILWTMNFEDVPLGFYYNFTYRGVTRYVSAVSLLRMLSGDVKDTIIFDCTISSTNVFFKIGSDMDLYKYISFSVPVRALMNIVYMKVKGLSLIT